MECVTSLPLSHLPGRLDVFMSVPMRCRVRAHMVASMLLLSSCGAGLIGGIVSSGGSGGDVGRAPQLSIASAELPLVPAPGDVRTVIVANSQLAGSDLAVQIRRVGQQGGVAVQRSVSARSQGTSTIVSFELDLAEIVATLSDPSAANVDAVLSVLAEGQLVGAAVPVLLVRQPKARLLLPPGQSDAELSPAGQRVMIEVEGLRSAEPAGLQVLVTTRDPEAGVLNATVKRFASDIAFETLASGVPTISATIPGNPFPDGLTIQVLDAIAGQSTLIENAYYRPEIALALPGQGPTLGGTQVTLIGSALVPYNFAAVPIEYDFDKVTLTFSKGGRITELPREDFRIAESERDRLLFTIPPSPDGRSGEVDIILKVMLDAREVIVTAKLFLFANPDPFFGPRGAVLGEPAVAAAPIALDNAPSTSEAPDFAILTEEGGVGFLQLLLAQQNGMFQPFSAPRQVGNHEVAAERSPRDLLVGDFDGDGVPDLFVVNEGVAGSAVHHVVLGQVRPNPPLGQVIKVPMPSGAVQGRVAFLDDDNLPDIVLLPVPGAPETQAIQVLLSRPAAIGQPEFQLMPSIDVGDFAYEALEVVDLNEDGILDVAVASGSELFLGVSLGVGGGLFAVAGAPLSFTVPNYGGPEPQSRAVGLHSCQNGARPSLALVLSGFASSRPPTVAVLRQGAVAGQFLPPGDDNVYVAPPLVEPFGKSLVANLDDDPAGIVEMVVAIRGEPTVVSGGILQFHDDTFDALVIESGTAVGTEVPVKVSSLSFATAFPAEQSSVEKKALFVVHEVEVDGFRERRLSTRLVQQVDGSPTLLPPDAGGNVPIVIDGIVGGNFSQLNLPAEGGVRDLALAANSGAQAGTISIIVNDGFGGFPALGQTLDYTGLLPDSMALVPGLPGGSDSLVFCSDAARLGLWDPRMHLLIQSQPLLAEQLDDDTQIRIADVDGDGVLDLVALLSIANGQPGGGSTKLALLRGKGAGASGFPFYDTPTMLSFAGRASSFALANFGADGGGALAVALTVPEATSPTQVDGNHIIFCRYQAGSNAAGDHFVRSAIPGETQQLLAGNEPVLVTAADFDGDGLKDLMVACRGDRSLRLFRNTVAPGGNANEVDVGAFEESIASRRELAAGVPTAMRLSDVNGDGNLDVVVVTEFVSASPDNTRSSVATYLSSGTGEVSEARFVSASRVGLFEERLSLDIGDWNRDGVPDLFLGWGLQATATVNLRVLFGGTKAAGATGGN